MALASKYDGKCKSCGSPHKIGNMIDLNAEDHWCIHGMRCTLKKGEAPNSEKATSTESRPPSPSPVIGTKLTPQQALAECVEFQTTFKDVDAGHFETLGKIYMSRLMERKF